MLNVLFGMRNNFSGLISPFLNFGGWKTKRKIVVFESDDWGGIRTPNQEALDTLKLHGVDYQKCNYMTYDRLESEQDLLRLYEVLNSVKDAKGAPACFTTNMIVANPNFKQIQEAEFSKYYYETFLETYNNYGFSQMKRIWELGINKGFVYPQLHGREHVNISRWLKDLINGVSETRLAFSYRMFGISANTVLIKRPSYLAVFDEINEALATKKEIIKEAANIFYSVFNYRSSTFIAPNYIWDDEVEEAALSCGISYFQGAYKQILPSKFGNEAILKKNTLGAISPKGIQYLIRNISFEPSSNVQKNWVEDTLRKIQLAFLLGKPAIIDTHRVNFMGGLSKSNQEFGLNSLGDLLNAIVRKWPNVEFLNSSELGHIINQSSSNENNCYR